MLSCVTWTGFWLQKRNIGRFGNVIKSSLFLALLLDSPEADLRGGIHFIFSDGVLLPKYKVTDTLSVSVGKSENAAAKALRFHLNLGYVCSGR